MHYYMVSLAELQMFPLASFSQATVNDKGASGGVIGLESPLADGHEITRLPLLTHEHKDGTTYLARVRNWPPKGVRIFGA